MEANISKRSETESQDQAHTQSEASGRGPADRPAFPCWTDDSSLLQSILQDANKKKEPARTQTDLSFKDFFRASLEATLEVSSWSRAYSAPQTQRGSERPPLTHGMKKHNSPSYSCSSSSSSCLNCARLERKVVELQEKLSHLQQLQHIEREPDSEQLESDIAEEEADTKWMEPLSPQSVCSDSSQNRTSAAAHKHSSRHPFQKSWLKEFWFLRYSPTQDRMWCHVCRRHVKHQKAPLISGSRTFRLSSIRRHSLSSCHIRSEERHASSVSAHKSDLL